MSEGQKELSDENCGYALARNASVRPCFVAGRKFGHVDRCLEVMDEIVGDERGLANAFVNGGAAETLNLLGAVCSHVDRNSQKMSTISQKVDNNPVIQAGFASGEIELF